MNGYRMFGPEVAELFQEYQRAASFVVRVFSDGERSLCWTESSDPVHAQASQSSGSERFEQV
jgi:hypothetical protein